MIPMNVSDNLNFKGRTLHLETQFRPGDISASLTLYESGRILFKAPVELPDNGDDQTYKARIIGKQKESFGILTFLFEIDEKVKTLRHGQSLICLGDLYTDWGLYPEAVEAYQIAAETDSVSDMATDRLSEVFIRSGKKDQARKVLQPFIEADTQYPAFREHWGRILFDEGDYNSAFTQFHHVERLGPCNARNALYLALTCMHLEMNRSGHQDTRVESRIRECTRYLVEALKRSRVLTRKDFDPVLQHLKSGDIRTAISTLNHLINIVRPEPDLAFQALFYLQFLYASQGREPQRIINYIQRMEAVAGNYPDHPEVRKYLGIGHVIQCREIYQKALHEFQKADLLSNGADPCHTLYESANRLGESFFQFIKELFS